MGAISYLGDKATIFQDNTGFMIGFSYYSSNLENDVNGFLNLTSEFASPTFTVANKSRSSDFFMETFNPGFKFNFFSSHSLGPYFAISPVVGVAYLKMASVPADMAPTQVSSVYGGQLSIGAQFQSDKKISSRVWAQVRNVKANKLVNVSNFNLSAFSVGISIGF